MVKGMTIKEATERWVREMNAIDQGIISNLMSNNPEDWEEMTVPKTGDRVYVYFVEGEGNGVEGEISSIREPSDDDEIDQTLYEINLDCGKTVFCDIQDFEVEYDYILPIWGTMWSFSDSADDYWLKELDGIRKMSDCGFRIFKSEEYGYFFGIDGAGYDFYEYRWIPLYKARGLQWHDPMTESGSYVMSKYREAELNYIV